MYNEQSYALGAQRSCIRELFEYGRQRAAEVGAENVLDFSLGNPSMPCPQEVTDAIADIVANTDPVALHGYTPAIGALETRKAIADDLNERFDAGVDPSELFITCGAAPGLTAVFKALAVPGGEILAIAPFFPEYKPFAETAGLKFNIVPATSHKLKLSTLLVEQHMTPNTVAVIINNPNNPTGMVSKEKLLKPFTDMLRRKAAEYGHPIYLISDEPYRELVYEDAEFTFLPKLYEDTIVCYSYSKSLSLPGERIGYVYVPREATDSRAIYTAIAGAARSLGHVCAPSLWQKVIARCARVRPDLTQYDANRKKLFYTLAVLGYELARPQGAFYIFVRIPGPDPKRFLEKAKARDLLLVPGDDFGAPGYFRMCYCVEPEKVAKSLPILAELYRESVDEL